LNFPLNLIFIQQSGQSEKFVRASLAHLFHVVISSLFQWPHGLRRGSTAARFLGLRVRILPVAWISIPYKCCVFLGRGICDRLITRPEESYRVCLSEFDREASVMRRP